MRVQDASARSPHPPSSSTLSGARALLRGLLGMGSSLDVIDLTQLEDTDMEDAEEHLPQPQPQTNGGPVKLNSLSPSNIQSNLNHGTFSSTLVVSPGIPAKRKSSGPEYDDIERFRATTPTPTQQKTPSESSHNVSVVIPSPSVAIEEYPKVKPRLNGLSEKYFPVESVQQAEASIRRYPGKSRAVGRDLVSLSADLGPRHRRNSTTEDLETIQRASLTHSLARLKASGPEILFNIEKKNLSMLASSFGFIQDYVLRDGVERVPEDFNTGCECPGGVCLPSKCSCLAQEEDSEELIVPYNLEKGTVTPEFLQRKSMIFECNHRCGCSGNCWFNVVQRGRKFQLEIFHTGNRGFGLRSPDYIRVGNYIDRYLGEVLTREESDGREDDQQISYLFGLDFMLGSTDIQEQEIYVVDGQKFGNATRFMNHSCNPNCKIIPVSIDHGDDRLYHLAFFALRDIPPGTELTFDYNPGFDKKDKKAAGAVKCLCGDKKCRGQLWPNKQQQQASPIGSPIDTNSGE